MANKKNSSRKRKHCFRGNQHDAKRAATMVSTPVAESSNDCLRVRKVNLASASLNALNESDYNLLINFDILKEFLMQVACCPDCSSRNVEFVDNLVLRMGYAHKLKFLCCDCAYEHDFYTSKQCNRMYEKQGRNKFECNVRAVVAFREIGKGHEALQNVSRCLNMYSLGEPCYRGINEELLDV